MNMKKRPITELMQIPFNTISLMFCNEKNSDANYKRFYHVNHNQTIDRRKVNFFE
jgi:hypothetical protein